MLLPINLIPFKVLEDEEPRSREVTWSGYKELPFLLWHSSPVLAELSIARAGRLMGVFCLTLTACRGEDRRERDCGGR